MIKYTLLLQFWAACLAAWVVVGSGVLVLVTDEDEFAVLGVAILAVAAIAVLTHPVLFAVEIAAVIAGVVFAIVMIVRADSQAALDLQDDGILPAAVMAVTLVGTWLCDLPPIVVPMVKLVLRPSDLPMGRGGVV